MPRRNDLRKILLIGSGPIVIGQACEFDYSGHAGLQGACGRRTTRSCWSTPIPATIMTDPNTADRTYIEPLTWEIVAKVIERERPDALLPTLGGQTGSEPRHGSGAPRRAGEVRRRDDRGQREGDREGRGAGAVQGGDGADRAGGLPRPDGAQHRRGPRGAQGDRLAVRRAAELHVGRIRVGGGVQPRRV